MDKVLAEQAFQQTGCTSEECAVKLGKLLNVQRMVVGSFGRLMDKFFVSLRVVDVESGKVMFADSARGRQVEDIEAGVKDLAAQIAKLAMKRAGPGTAAEQAGADEARRTAEEAATKEAARREEERLKAERKAAEALLPVDPRVARGRFGIGFNYPGLGLRALIGTRWMLEVRGQYEKEAQVYGGRLYLYAFPSGRLYPYLGAGGAWARYRGDGFDAVGPLGEAFAGLEYFIFRSASLQFDCGPAYVGLGNAGVSVNGIRFVVNFGLMYYF
jgi:hypothetical protein